LDKNTYEMIKNYCLLACICSGWLGIGGGAKKGGGGVDGGGERRRPKIEPATALPARYETIALRLG